ncbi:hypothetical protein L7D48_14060 [Streptomyces sp. S1A]|uniref:DUF5709 domain-containing protein n=1 Tax=Streptomyces chitinivorans TaxID=1257027 RepID=A0ABW7HX79_9ACTN|nr:MULTISPECIES: hypothetical protein [Streptomyces]MCG3041673.1 hypothetical protein [Streptomyces sp. ICN903]MDH2407877.1 hypothetical protein [Streptomyces chitinivorans]
MADENEPTAAGDESRPELAEEDATVNDDETPGLPPEGEPATGPSPGDSALDAPYDPGGRPEDEGIPDLQNGMPEQEWMNDPQQMPVPGERPVAAEEWGTTYSEQVEGKPLGDRLAEEEPDVGETSRASGPPEEETGQLSDDPLGERPANQDVFSHESAAEGLSPEESAVHTVEEDRDIGQLRGEEDTEQTGPPEGVGEVGPSGEGEGTGVRPEPGRSRRP